MNFEGSLKRLKEEILPLVQQSQFPPKLPDDSLQGSLDLILYRNLCFSLEFCFTPTSPSASFNLSRPEWEELSRYCRGVIIPAYLSFFNAHLLTESGGKCALFFVRQESNSSWSKLLWNRIKQVAHSVKKAEHELGLQMPGDLLDAFARLMDIFLPGDVKKFEALAFDLRTDDPTILEAIIQGGLVGPSDPLAAKNAFYLLNRIVSFSKLASTGSSEQSLFGVPLRVWEQFVVCYAAVQESQVHLILPLLPVLKSMLMKQELSMAWWRVLIVKGLGNDSIPCRRVLMHAVLSVDARECAALCCPDGLDFCLDDLLRWGVDPNSGFLVTPQALSSSDDNQKVVDLGEMVAVFFANLIEAYSRISPGHGRAIIKELLAAIEDTVRVPVGLIFVLKAFKQTSASFPALDDSALESLARLATLPSLHNQRARLLVKWQLCELLMAFADASAISFDRLCGTLNELVLESIQLHTLGEDSEHFTQLSTWMNSCFGAEYLREGVLIALQQFFTSSSLDDVRGLKEKAQILATMCVFSLGSPDGRFVSFSRVIFEQLALVSMTNDESCADAGVDAIPAFVMFLALNESVQAVLKGRNDLITQLGSTKKIFEWLSFLDDCLFGHGKQTDLTACQVLLEAFSLLINRASDNDERQLMQFLDMLSFRLVTFIADKSLKQKQRDVGNEPEEVEDVEVGFTGLLTVFAAMTALSAVLRKLADLGHVRESLLSGPMVQRLIRFKLERPGGLNESQWDLWPTFVTLFTAAKWKCIEAMAVTMRPAQNDELSLLSILASCIQALEVSKYGGTLAILKCTGTLINLILKTPDIDPAFDALFEREAEIMKSVLRGQAETQRWFDLYADSFIKVSFSTAVLCAACDRPPVLAVLHDLFDFFCAELGPKRRGTVALMSAKLGAFFLGNKQHGRAALDLHWRHQLLQLLLYGPVRGSIDESVAARVTHEHVPDSDYQVRVHAITVLNHLTGAAALLKDLLMDLIGRQEAINSGSRRKMFPGDANHRLKLRSWAGILLLIGILIKQNELPLDDAKELVEMLWRFIGEETMDSTRVFMEWSLGLIYLKHSDALIFPDLISLRMNKFEGFSCQIVSVLSVALLIGKCIEVVAPELARTQFFPKMADHVLPLLAHNNHFVRMRAIHAFSILYRPSQDVLGYKLLEGYINGTDHCRKFIKKCQDDLITSPRGLQPLEDLNLEYIFGKLMSFGGVEGEAIEYYSFMNYHESEGVIPFTNVKTPSAVAKPMPSLVPDSGSGASIDFDDLFKDFQQKIDIYSPALEAENQSKKQLGTELLVVASLLEKLPNLAGLARSCEIFGVKRLFVPATADLTSPDFVNVAMTADKWLEMKSLAIEAIPTFLSSLKLEGYKIVALEQTANSVPLQTYSFAAKTCLVLGNERTGVPAEVLHAVDECVEIPQFGRVRSLNVHVSGSIAIWKAREQDLQ